MLSISRLQGVSRLAVFIVDATSGKPCPRVPVYAEIALADGGLVVGEIKGMVEIRAEAPQLEPMIVEEIQAYFGSTFLAEQTEVWLANFLIFISDKLRKEGLFAGAADIEKARATTRAAIEALAKRGNIPRGIEKDIVRYPLGVLSTDQVGFVSFDLERAGLPDPTKTGSLAAQQVMALVYPYMSDALMTDIVPQGRIAPDAIVGKIAIDAGRFSSAPALNLPPLQNPSLVDWRLSPGSFAATPLSLIGADGCQSYTPANFATSQVNVRQIVRLEGDVEDGFPKACVLEYSVSFIPIGHSLGQMLYSLPLAPGESTRLAVMNWRRSDSGQRSEETVITESLVHSQSRDRLITETVDAALDEWQRGGSVMGGMAQGSGAARGASGSGNASASLYNIIGLGASGGAGAGSAMGNMISAGGAYSTSSGSRDLAVDTMQKVTDRISQASTAVRELHSTVVVQTDQKESQAIETRAFANHNRGHTLNILYHEVLQHYRVVTEFKKKYAAVLMPRLARDFNNDVFILGMRHRLSPVALEKDVMDAGIGGLVEIDKVRKERERFPPPPPQWWIGDLKFRRFQFLTRVNDDNTANNVRIWANRYQSAYEALQLKYPQINWATYTLEQATDLDFNRSKAFDHQNIDQTLDTADVDIPWWDLKDITVRMMADSGDVHLTRFDVLGIDENGFSHQLGSLSGTGKLEKDEQSIIIPIRPPDPLVRPAPPVVLSPEQTVGPDSFYAARRLKDHLWSEAQYYGRALDLSEDPNAYAISFEGMDFGSDKAIDHVAPTPLEILGSYIAFPMIDQDEMIRTMEKEAKEGKTPPPVESLISLPTRGVFAEAKLGHCNVAEEIDETRFWRWDEHPNPFMASEIAPVTPVTPQTIQLDLQGTTLPNPIISIQQPQTVPDPTGMSEALKLMAVANIFRDMSGRTEVAGMIKDLIEGSVSMADLAVKAMEAAKPSGGTGGTSTGGSGGTGGGSGGGAPGSGSSPSVPTQTPGEADRADIDNTERKLEVANKHLPPSEKKKVWEQAAKDLTETNRTITIDIYAPGEGMVLDVPIPGDAGIIKDNHEYYIGKAVFISGVTSVYTKFQSGRLHLKFESAIHDFEGIQYVDDIPGLQVSQGTHYYEAVGAFNFGDADEINMKGVVLLSPAIEVTVNVNGSAKIVVSGEIGADVKGIGKIGVKEQTELGAGAGVQIKYTIQRIAGLKLVQVKE